MVAAVSASTEFRLRHREWESGREDDWQSRELGGALRSFGDDETFVSACYQVLLGRDADAPGGAFYVSRLRDGAERYSIVQTLATSDEFAARVRQLNPGVGRIPRDAQLCELANPAKWDNPEWHAILRSFQTVPTDQASMHRKAYEYTQTIFGLQRLGALTRDARVLSVGAGHEVILYWLANHVGRVVATDLYQGEWQSAFAMEGHPSVLRDPAEFAPFPYRRERLAFSRMDGSRLGFVSAAFDIVYSLSSIEHFDGAGGAIRAVAEMARVLKPGGVLALATEWCINDRPAGEIFAPDEVRAIVNRPDLALVQPIDDRVWDRYESDPVDLRVNRFQTPHMLLKDGDTIFTSVMLFLRKLN